jgi:hypothetical protein
MDLAVTGFEGDTLHAVAELVGLGHPLIVVGDRSAWARVSVGLEPAEVSALVVSRPSRDLSVVRADLNLQPRRPAEVAGLISAVYGDVVALRPATDWADADVLALVAQLIGDGRPVVFFVPSRTRLGVLATITPPAVLVGPLLDTRTVIGTWSDERSDPSVLHVVEPRDLRIEDLVDHFNSWYWTTRPHGYTDIDIGGDLPVGPVLRTGGVSVGRPGAPAHVWGEAPPPIAPQVAEERSVNTLIVRPGTSVAVDPAVPLEPASGYEVLVNIDTYRAASLLTEAEARWPSEPLPDGDLVLRAALSMDGDVEPRVVRFTLPSHGASFACDCAEDAHARDCVRQPWVRFPIATPVGSTVWTGELVIYFGVVAVHAQQLFLPIGAVATDGMHARLVYRLTRSFADLGSLAERAASVLVTDGGSRALVNGVRFADNPAWISANAADNAVRAARQLLYDLHLTDGRSTLDADHGKSAAEFTADLAALARQGAVLFERLFRDNRVFDTLPELIRHEAAARGRPAVLNVADPTIGDPDRQHPVPWSLIYDLPMPQDPGGEYRVCPSVRRFGPEGTGEPVPPHCPEPDHAGGVLCPFGFWGLSTVVEQPASTDSLVWHVFSGTLPAQVELVTDPRLDGQLTDRHLAGLDSALPHGTVHHSVIESPRELAEVLALETMDIGYLYCHGGYHKLADNALPSPVLRFGTSMLDPVTVANWRRDGGWPRPHWPSRKPLIVLNGCHTAELTTATLSSFVDAFANRAGAAGVIGTEITIEQGMAGWAIEQLLRLLVDGASAGQALRALRWQMINRGNVLGLAYTLYCVAGLRLRPQGLARKDPA